MHKEKMYVIGVGGHAKSVAESIISSGFEIESFIGQDSKEKDILGYPVEVAIREYSQSINIVITIGDNSIRRKVFEEMKEKYPNARFPNIIHSSASISRFSKIGIGNVFLQGSIVGSNTIIEDFTILNTGSAVDHDCRIESFASFAPASHSGGSVFLGKGSAIGIGASIKHGIKIGKNVVIGSKSYVDKDLESNGVYYGIPARFIRSRSVGDCYL